MISSKKMKGKEKQLTLIDSVISGPLHTQQILDGEGIRGAQHRALVQETLMFYRETYSGVVCYLPSTNRIRKTEFNKSLISQNNFNLQWKILDPFGLSKSDLLVLRVETFFCFKVFYRDVCPW
jgi:hypothetical protein